MTPYQKILFSTLALISAGFSTIAVAEECLVCTPVLRMNETRAQCIDERHLEFMQRANDSDLGVVFFNIDACAYDGEEVRSVVEEMDGDPIPPAELDRSVILDAARIECIVSVLQKPDTRLNPDLYIDLTSSC